MTLYLEDIQFLSISNASLDFFFLSKKYSNITFIQKEILSNGFTFFVYEIFPKIQRYNIQLITPKQIDLISCAYIYLFKNYSENK